MSFVRELESAMSRILHARKDSPLSRFAECESALAGSMTPTHLRRRAAGEALRLSGSVTELMTLCGAELPQGSWDTPAEVTAEHVRVLSRLSPDRSGRLCSSCAAVYEAEDVGMS